MTCKSITAVLSGPVLPSAISQRGQPVIVWLHEGDCSCCRQLIRQAGSSSRTSGFIPDVAGRQPVTASVALGPLLVLAALTSTSTSTSRVG